jgi:DNA-binding SARP family transcriptional activator
MPTPEGQLNLLGAPHLFSAVRERRDVPDSLPGYLIAYLAYRGDWVTREALAGLFWPERAEDEAQHNLRANLHRTRTLLTGWGQGEALQADRRRVRIDLPTDVAAFRAALGRADWAAATALHGEPLLSVMTFRGLALLEMPR